MARIAGIDIPRDKKVPYSLRYIYGIGFTTAKEILLQNLKNYSMTLNSHQFEIFLVLKIERNPSFNS